MDFWENPLPIEPYISSFRLTSSITGISAGVVAALSKLISGRVVPSASSTGSSTPATYWRMLSIVYSSSADAGVQAAAIQIVSIRQQMRVHLFFMFSLL